MKTKKVLIGMMAMFVSMSAMADDPTISGVTVRQRWPWSRLVDIDYVITDATPAVDIAVQAFNGAQPLTLDVGLSGDLYGVTGQGMRRIIWDPTQSQYTNEEVLTKFRVTLAPITPPLYMIVDLTKTAGAEGQITYVYEADLASGVYGTVETNPVAGVNSIVWTGVTNDIYKTDKLVFRRINPGSFKTGGCGYRFSGSNWLLPGAYPATNTITLSQPYYIGIFLLTQSQAVKMGGGNVSRNKMDPKLPTEYRTYDALRGAVMDNPSINWPATGYQISAGSQMKKYRDALGFDVDIPTDAQWEYACRAGTTTLWSDGISRTFDTILATVGTVAIGQAVTDFNNAVVAYGCFSNSRTGDLTDIVGLFKPNAWGLYDMHGNVCEWCLDWAPVGRMSGTLSGVEYDTSLQMFRVDAADYAGCASGTSRILHGGNHLQTATYSTPAYRYATAPSTANGIYGYRLVCFPNGVTPKVGEITPLPAE
ncbi:MAG: SUMF1/EgtB/PvdO family nonheme iron enzyme [Kiritimatiellia bacterium]